ncbi:N-glycosylase/DNA lyase [Candidatus Woesearchaeota archaeon]|nr:N-glycosylase/DNA lyase [Candidatus Woesearchaeota archaeon]
MDNKLVVEKYNEIKDEIKEAIKGYKSVKNEKDLFYELCFTILTPQSNGFRCWKIVEDLKKMKFFEKSLELKKLQDFLQRRVRFHNHKGEYLTLMKENWKKIFENLKEENNEKLREWLVENIKGHGLKEGSHFLRNIGRENLAILDRHILRCLTNLNVIDEIPKSLTKKKYFEIENMFKKYSDKIRIKMDELDLLFWSMATGKVFK